MTQKAVEKRCEYKMANGKECGVRCVGYGRVKYCKQHHKAAHREQNREYARRRTATRRGEAAPGSPRIWKRSEVCPLCNRPFFPSEKKPHAKLCTCTVVPECRAVEAVAEYNPLTGQITVRSVPGKRLNIEATA